jgi:alkanesulfonate monooxygenase SsuD/methylene tetrahydromethanopterin reductase-like flavin-dependent oxidoreductase (luciferase family)
VVVDSSLDPTLGLQCAARATSRLRLGYSGELPSVQPAAVRAKQIASVDWFSGGRVHLGLSLERYAAMCALWTQRRARHAGERFSFRGASALPRPLGDRVPTTHVRSTSAAVLERFVAGAGVPDGWLAWRETPEQLVAGVAVLEAVLGAAAADVRRTWFVDVDSVAEARAAVTGLDVRVDELVVVLDRLPTADDLRALAPSAAA